MPHIDPVTEGRERAEEFISNIGDKLDPNKEQEDQLAKEEGEHENLDMAVKDPTLSGIMTDETVVTSGDRTFRKIELQDDKELFAKTRTLDVDQRAVIDKVVGFARQYQRALARKNPWPKSPELIVHGGAGSGKSHVIDVLSQLLEKVFRTSGDDPNCPYILKLAFTGNAGSIVHGQTIHSAFQLPFNNNINSLMDKLRDMRRKQLHNLRLIMIDEMSLMKSDILYQIHFRLSKDIFQNNLTYGGIALVVLGDILQIKPPLGSLLFNEPKNEK